MSSHRLRTHAIYTYIVQCYEQNQLPPTMREISEACDIPLGATFRHLDWLQARGYITRDNTTRSIRPLKVFLKDEDHIYQCIIRTVDMSNCVPSLRSIKKISALSSARVKSALQILEQTGRIYRSSEDPHMIHLVETKE